MGVREVKDFFKKNEHQMEIMEFEQSSATVNLAAAALNVGPDQIAKTIAFCLKKENMVVVMSGCAKLDNRKFKDTFKEKAKMIPADELEEVTGHPVGGVCPFGLRKEIAVYLDESLKKHASVFPAAGAPNTAVCVKVDELEEITGGCWVKVCSDKGLDKL